MEQVKVTDEWLYKYMPIVDAAIINNLDDKKDDVYERLDRFTSAFQRGNSSWTCEIYNNYG